MAGGIADGQRHRNSLTAGRIAAAALETLGVVRSVEVSRTLVKSPPELWEELQGDCLSEAIGEVTVQPTKPEEELAWRADGARGWARISPSNWGTKVVLTAEVEEQVAEVGLWERMRGMRPPPAKHADIEQRLEGLLDTLGSAHKKPYSAE